MIEHANIPDAYLHEPKGVAGASSGQIYVADGASSGSWKSPLIAVGQMGFSTNTTATLVAAASDATLATDGDYVKVTANLIGSSLSGVSFLTDKLVVVTAGIYSYSLTASVVTAGASYTGIRIARAGSVGTSKSVATTAAGVITTLTLSGLITLSVADTVDIWVANTVGNVTLKDCNLSLQRVGIL